VINLLGTGEKIQLITSAAGSVDVALAYINWDTATQTGKNPQGLAYNVTTAATTDLLVGVATDPRNLKFLNVRNASATVSNVITIQTIIGGVTAPLWKGTLLPSEWVTVNDAGTPFFYNAAGGVKSAGADTIDPKTNDFRITGVSGTPVMTANSTALSTIYLAQYRGNRIALYDGLNWQVAQPASEINLAVTGRTTDLPFDVFAFLNAGVVTLEFLNWSTATARATALARLDGVWVKSGDATRRYLGSCRPRSATVFHWVLKGDDLPVKFDLWNVENRVEYSFVLRSLTNTWAYTLATWRQCQGSVNYQVDIVVGVEEDDFVGQVVVSSRNSTISIPRHVGIGFDATTAIHATCTTAATANTVASIEADQNASIAHMPTIGVHKYCWLEISTATGTCTWIGDDGALRLQSGFTGFWDA
jgi:hypothetical protein